MRARLDAVLFDFDHTLGIDNHLEELVLAEMAQLHCDVQPTRDQITAALARFRDGSASLVHMLADFFRAPLDKAEALLAEYKSRALHAVPSMVKPIPGARETLQSLESSRFRVGILSNGWTELQRAKAATIGFFGPLFVSEQIEAWKPARAAFEVAAREIGAALERSMYVGDSPRADVAGAKNAGMIAVWANLENQVYPDDLVKPDYMITRLPDLEGLVGP